MLKNGQIPYAVYSGEDRIPAEYESENPRRKKSHADKVK